MGKHWFQRERTAPYPRIIPKEKWGEVVDDYWTTLCLQTVGDKFGVSRERIRQIIELQGQNPTEIKTAIRDRIKFFEIQAKYKTCRKCRKHYIKPWRKLAETKNHDFLCHRCIGKIRHKLNGYRYQKEWAERNPEKVKELSNIYSRAWHKKNPERVRENRKKYYWANREKFLIRQKAYWARRKVENPEWFSEWRSQSYIKRNLLNPKDKI